VGHFAGFWEFATRPSLTDTPACRQAAKTLEAMREVQCHWEAKKTEDKDK